MATVADSIWVSSAVLVSCPADDSSSEEAVDTVWMILPIAESNPSAICCIAALRSPSAFSFWPACSCSIDWTRSAFSLKTWTARAMPPTSSPRLSAGTGISRSPPARPFITEVISAIGRITPNATPKMPAPMTRNTTAETPHNSSVNVLTRRSPQLPSPRSGRWRL